MSLLTRFKSDKKLQTESLDILTELIRRDLLRVNMLVSNISINVTCHPTEAYVTGSRDATAKEIFRSRMTNSPVPSKKAGPGITISLREQFRLATDKEEKEVREVLKREGLSRFS